MKPHPMTRFLKDFARGPIPRAVRYHGPKGFRWEEIFKGHETLKPYSNPYFAQNSNPELMTSLEYLRQILLF